MNIKNIISFSINNTVIIISNNIIITKEVPRGAWSAFGPRDNWATIVNLPFAKT